MEEAILVGAKPIGVYLRSLDVVFRSKNLKKAVIKARGRNISKAVDIAEASRNKFYKDLNLQVDEVKISTEKFKKTFENDGKKEEKELSVSCIEISISRK